MILVSFRLRPYFVFLNLGACNWTQWSLLFAAYKARRKRRRMALPAERRLAPLASSCPVHELPGVLQCSHPGTRAHWRIFLSGLIGTPSITKISLQICPLFIFIKAVGYWCFVVSLIVLEWVRILVYRLLGSFNCHKKTRFSLLSLEKLLILFWLST